MTAMFGNGPFPRIDTILKDMERLMSVMDAYGHHTDTQTFTGTDEDATVQATLDGRGFLTDLYIEDGLLRLGEQTVEDRINDALANARAAAESGIAAQQAVVVDKLADFAGALMNQFQPR